MSQTDNDFSTQNITPTLISQVVDALRNKAYGSVEIYIENHKVVQITERTITKVNSIYRRVKISRNNGNKKYFSQDPKVNYTKQ